ncbi:MAG: glycoside hydrolase family 3 C-terminal domain-containing protein, partial [Clostridia bacterium]|nr:glycoside hydrolase family 3 C-terminal domain-containing protein [Clostridia bacterium]
ACEKAVFVVGRTAGENDDTSPTDGDYRLSPDERAIYESLRKHFAKIAVIINSGNLIDISFTKYDEVKAVVMLNLPGMEGGNALGDILSGKVCPSGKLTDTIAKRYVDYPTSECFGRKAGIIQNYYEDIFVGYRYFETFEDVTHRVLYHFGHGLSYTTFEKRLVSFECTGIDGDVNVKVAVKNTGEKYAGKEVVMIYSSAPEAARAPKYELRAFEKTKLLAPGEEEILEISFKTEEIASFCDYHYTAKDEWQIVFGEYRFYYGTSTAELELAGTILNTNHHVVKKCAHIPTELSERLTSEGEYEQLPAIPPDTTNGIPVGPSDALSIGAEQYTEMSDELAEGFAEHDVDVNNIRVYRLNMSTAGTYRLKFSADNMPKEAYLGTHPLAYFENYFSENGAEIILPPGKVEFSFKGEGEKPLVSFEFEKLDETVYVRSEGSSLLECGKFTECALYVISREFMDEEGLIKHGRGLFRMHTPGRYAMYKLEVEKAGYYDLILRYSTYHDTRDLAKTYSFMVSNVTQTIESVTLEKTTEEDAPFVFRTAKPIRLALPAGEAYLKIVSKTKKTPHLAYIEIKPSTRKVYIEEEKDEGFEAENIPLEYNDNTCGYFPRKELPEIAGKYDFRNVLAGKIALDEFVADLSDMELATLSCGNKNGHIGRVSERGIPESYWSDGSVGYRQNYKVTVYPSSTMVAATWNKALAREFGRSIGCEGNLYNADVWLAPAINIHRDPCCGRNFEYMSEDPYVTGTIAAEIVKGVQEFSVAATVKHFAANNTEYQRMKSNSRVSARALREIYMKAFEIIIKEAQPFAIMTSYNHINGIKVSENPIFVETVLREEFGFKGLVMSDFSNDSDHVRELAATQDLKMHFGDPRTVCKHLAEGTLSRETVRACVKRVLELIMKTTCVNSEVK